MTISPAAILESPTIRLCLRQDGGLDLENKSSSLQFCQTSNANFHLSDLSCQDNSLIYHIESDSLTLRVQLSIDSDESVSLRLESDNLLTTPLPYPNSWTSLANDEIILPVGTGICFSADTPPTNLPEQLHFYSGSHASMGLYGLRREAWYIFSAVGDTCDAELSLDRDAVGRLCPQVVWIGQKGEFAYTREMRYFLGHDLAEPLRRYANWRNSQRQVVTLRQHAEVNPELQRFFGAASLWLWDDNAMNRLYGRPLLSHPTQLTAETAADELLAAGMDHVLWNSFDGESPATCAALKSRGFLVGKYDVYRDVVPKPLADYILPYRRKRSVNTVDWPDIVAVDADGTFRSAWALHGLDGKLHNQHAVCDSAALKLTRRNVPPDVERVGYTARLIDVQAGSALQECYALDHPATRRESLEAICQQMQFLSGLGLVCGVEVGCEAALGTYHYSEGMMSPPFWRAPDAGRRMTTLYRGAEIPDTILTYMLNPKFRLPLWQLVWHDCCVSYWYWGDSNNSCPELMARRDLFNLLYGEPPLYSLAKADWRELKSAVTASYARVHPVARDVAGAKMINFEYLTADKMVQRTVFDNGTAVTVNFSDQSFTDSGIELSPGGYHVVSSSRK